MAFVPVFIMGVPRSGTTLLRVMLDSHSQIAAPPETPWLSGAYGPESSLRALLQDLMEGPYGAVRNVSGVEPDHVLAAGRRFLEELFAPYLKDKNKHVLVFKTPQDIRHVGFLMKFMPDARFIHITRDGRDVCMSQMAKKGSFFRDLKEFGRLSYANTFRRWVEWEQRVRDALYRQGVHVARIRYEDLTADPRTELQKLTDFLGVPFEAKMLDYASSEHDLPAWEAGSTDVAARKGVSAASIGKWRRAKMTTEMMYTLTKYDAFLVGLGYPSSDISPGILDRILLAAFPFVKAPADLGAALLTISKKRARSMLSAAAVLGLVAIGLFASIPGIF